MVTARICEAKVKKCADLNGNREVGYANKENSRGAESAF